MIRRFIFLLICVFTALSVFSQVKLRSGIIAGIGNSSLHDNKILNVSDIAEFSFSPGFTASTGYKFRLQPERKRFFWDIDAQFVYRRLTCDFYKDFWSNYTLESRPNVPTSLFNDTYFQFSLNPTFNYTIFDGWYAGAGIEPGVIFVSPQNKLMREDELKFDVPLTARFGYDFKYVDLSFNYKYGLTDMLDANFFRSGKFSSWQIQLFIPF